MVIPKKRTERDILWIDYQSDKVSVDMQNTRNNIMDFLEANNQATTVELSQVLSMTQANIRHHLSILIDEGKVEVIGQNQADGRGRPTFLYMPTRQAQPHSLDILLNILLEDILLLGSAKQRERKIRRLAERLSLSNIDNNKSITIRLGACVRHLNKLHYQAHWEARQDFPIIIFGRCPYAPVIDQYPALCTMDKYVLEISLKREVKQSIKITRLPQGPKNCQFIIYAEKKGPS
ncbi:MAG: ArsR family transcriptional regulator [Anaerolineales bacterium]